MRSVSFILFFLLVGCATEPVAPPSKLLHFDSPERASNQYLIQFKKGGELARDVPASVERKLKVSPNTVPTDPKAIQRLAEERAKAEQGNRVTAGAKY